MVVGGRGAPLHDRLDVDRQHLVAADARRSRASDPDVLARESREAVDTGDRVEHRLVARHGKTGHVVAVARPFRDHVINLRVVAEHVDAHERRVEVFRKLCLDGLLRLGESHAGDVDVAVGAEIDRAIGAHEVFPGDLLLACRLGQRERYLRLAEDSLQVAKHGVLGLFERLAAHHHLAVRGAQVEHATRLHHIQSADRLFEERALHDDLERVKRLDAERRFRHHAERVDEQDVGGLDHIGRQRHFRQFLGGHPARFGWAIGVERRLAGGGSLGAAVDAAATRKDRRSDQQGHAGAMEPPAEPPSGGPSTAFLRGIRGVHAKSLQSA